MTAWKKAGAPTDSDEVYNVSEIRGYNFKLESDKERLKLYQNLWGRYY